MTTTTTTTAQPAKEAPKANTPTDAQANDAAVAAKVPDEDTINARSSAEPIPSTVLKRFYDEGGRLVREGTTYVYMPKKELPYPWPLLRPIDDSLAKRLKEEYEDFKDEKMARLDKRQQALDAINLFRG